MTPEQTKWVKKAKGHIKGAQNALTNAGEPFTNCTMEHKLGQFWDEFDDLLRNEKNK